MTNDPWYPNYIQWFRSPILAVGAPARLTLLNLILMLGLAVTFHHWGFALAGVVSQGVLVYLTARIRDDYGVRPATVKEQAFLQRSRRHGH